LGALKGAKAAQDFLLHFEYADILLHQIIAEGNSIWKRHGGIHQLTIPAF
jgi:hypothetical protein